MVLSNKDLMDYIKNRKLVVTPFEEEILSSNGLDLRIGNHIARLIYIHSKNKVFDSKKENLEKWYRTKQFNDSFIIYPRERLLCHTLEYLKLPNDIMGVCQIRSTFARMGLSIPPTTVDAGYEGQLTIELIGGNFPIKLYARQRVIHMIFHKLITPTSLPYRGRYQKQKGLTLPKLTEMLDNSIKHRNRDL